MNDKLTVGKVTPLQPSIGPGNNPMCERCIVKQEQDVVKREQDTEHQIVELLKTKSLPYEIVNGVNVWSGIADLLKILEVQCGKQQRPFDR